MAKGNTLQYILGKLDTKKLYRGKIDKLKADNKRLREAVEKYGDHDIHCEIRLFFDTTKIDEKGNTIVKSGECTCGYDQALTTQQGEK